MARQLVELDESYDFLLLRAGGFQNEDGVCRGVRSGICKETGILGGEIITNSVSSMSFVVT